MGQLLRFCLTALLVLPSLLLASGFLTPRRLRAPIIVMAAAALALSLWLQAILAAPLASHWFAGFATALVSFAGEVIRTLVSFVDRGLARLGLSAAIPLPSLGIGAGRSASRLLSGRESWFLSVGFVLAYAAIRVAIWAVYAVCRGVLAVIRATFAVILRLIGRSGRKSASAAPHPALIFDLPRSCQFLKPVLSATAVVVGLAVTLPLLIDLPAAMDAFYERFFWAGAWIVLLEAVPMTRARRAPKKERSVTAVGAGETEAGAPLQALYGSYVDRYGDLLLHRTVFDRGEGIDASRVFTDDLPGPIVLAKLAERFDDLFPGDAGAVGQAVDLARALIVPRDDRRAGTVLLSESLSRTHIVFVVELVQHFEAQGGLVLLICPDGLEGEIEAALRREQDPLAAALSERWLIAGARPLARDSQLGFVLCSEQRFETLVTESDSSWIDRLRLVVFIGFDALQGTILRQQLSRLWQRVQPGRVSILVQSEPDNEIEARLEAITGRRIEREMIWAPDARTTRYMLLWDGSPDKRANLSARSYGHLDVVADYCFAVPRLAWSEGFDTFFYDRQGEFNDDAWESVRNAALRSGREDSEVWRRLRNFGRGRILRGTGSAAILVAEENSSLPRALRRNYNFAHGSAAMIHLVSWPYLLRDWHLHLLRANGLPALLRFEPLAAQPGGGAVDLALRVEAALRERPRSRRELVEILRSAAAPQITSLGVAADLAGLRALLALIGATARPARFEGESWRDRRYAPGTKPISRGRHLDLFPEGGGAAYPFQLRAHEYGLTYAERQLLLIAGRLLELIEVGESAVQVRTVERDSGAGRPSYRFARTYRLGFLSELNGSRLAEDFGRLEFPSGGRLRLTIFTGEIKRETRGYLEYARGSKPLASGSDQAFAYHRLPRPVQQSTPNAGCCRMRMTEIAVADADARWRIAFTLCAVLQDMMVSLFPNEHRRIAVVSPQASSPRSAAAAGENRRDGSFIARYFPTFAADSVARDAASDADAIEVLVVEDSEFEIGVARSVALHNDRIRREMRDFLAWAVERPAAELYHAFGTEALDPAFDYRAALDYLNNFVAREPILASAAGGSDAAKDSGRTTETRLFDRLKRCDFCGGSIGTPHYRLRDGRKQCGGCHQSALRPEDFSALSRDTALAMQHRYGIAFPSDISVHCIDAGTIAQYLGQSFTPEAGMTPRTVGLATRLEEGGYRILIENGAPRLATIATLAHELTHIWQFALPTAEPQPPLEIVEGQAVVAEIDYLRGIGEYRFSFSLRAHYAVRRDEYGRGYRLVSARARHGSQPLFRSFREMLAHGRDASG